MWGSIQSSVNVKPGWRIVTTAGHGGHMMTYNFAEEHLPEPFLKLMPTSNGYYCFEEDSLYTLPLCLNDTLKKAFWEFIKGRGSNTTYEDLESSLLDDASTWHADILRAFDVTPSASAKTFDVHQEADRLRSEKSPDIAVCAWGGWETFVVGATLVLTAAGTYVLCTSSSYTGARKRAHEQGTARTMDFVEQIPFESLEPLSVRARQYINMRVKTHNDKDSTVMSLQHQPIEDVVKFISSRFKSDLLGVLSRNASDDACIHGKLNCDLAESDIDDFIQQVSLEITQQN